MLHKSWITNIQFLTDEWKMFRLGKFTSSKMVELMAEKELSAGALSYIDQKVGEFVAGQTLSDENDELEDENTVWGREHEPMALKAFASIQKIQFLVTEKVIHQPGSQTSSTPDGIHIISSSVTKEDCYNVATVEVKCPRKYTRFLPFYRCQTPEQVKKLSKKYYWQVLDQMDTCGAPIGYLVCYHPLFPAGRNIRIIEFRKLDLWDDFKLLEQRKLSAIAKFKELLADFVV